MSDSNCALGPDGKLLDASKIAWYNDKDDDVPLAPSSIPASMALSRPTRRRVPASRLTRDNAEAPQLTSHQEAIRAEEERQKLQDLAKRDPKTASLGSPTPADSSSEEEEQPKMKGQTRSVCLAHTHHFHCRQTGSSRIPVWLHRWKRVSEGYPSDAD